MSMTTGEALVLVHEMAKANWSETNTGSVTDMRKAYALDVVEDLIVNHYGEEDESNEND